MERGRYTMPKIHVPITERLCPCCNVVEDKHHFLLTCKIFDPDRNEMFSKISTKYENICGIESRNKFKFLLTNDDPLVLNALGKFIQRFKGVKFGWNSRCRQSGMHICCRLRLSLSIRQSPVRPAKTILPLAFFPSDIYHMCFYVSSYLTPRLMLVSNV